MARVTAQDSKRISVAALVCARPGATRRSRLSYRTHLDWGHGKHRRKGITRQRIDQGAALVKTRLTRMQYRPGLIDGFLAKPGPDLTS